MKERTAMTEAKGLLNVHLTRANRSIAEIKAASEQKGAIYTDNTEALQGLVFFKETYEEAMRCIEQEKPLDALTELKRKIEEELAEDHDNVVKLEARLIIRTAIDILKISEQYEHR